jgi:uncharacterized protein YggU (UPF0235/DUF167 family)
MEKYIQAKIFPNAKANKVVPLPGDKFEIYTKEPPENDRANISVISQLSDNFKLEQKQIIIVKGRKQTCKINNIHLK